MTGMCGGEVTQTGSRMERVTRMIAAASKGAGPSGLMGHGMSPVLVGDMCTDVLAYMYFRDDLGVRGARGDNGAWLEFIEGILPFIRRRAFGVCPVDEYSDAWACHVQFALALAYGFNGRA